MNLFAARLTGKMSSTEAFEKNITEMQERVARWRAIEKSPELAEYLDLKKKVESSDFQERKNELVNRKYKDTDEGRKMSALERLNSSMRMKGYKYALENENFQAFLKFRDSDAFQNREDNSVSASERRMYNMIYRSAFYKNYQKVLNSPELKQLTELEKETATEDFKKRNALMSPIQDEIYNAIKDIADTRGYQLVLDRASDTGIIFGSPKIDISSEVLSKLGYTN